MGLLNHSGQEWKQYRKVKPLPYDEEYYDLDKTDIKDSQEIEIDGSGFYIFSGTLTGTGGTSTETITFPRKYRMFDISMRPLAAGTAICYIQEAIPARELFRATGAGTTVTNDELQDEEFRTGSSIVFTWNGAIGNDATYTIRGFQEEY